MNGDRMDSNGQGSPSSRYSRSEGVASYRRRRRVSKIARGLVAVVLLAILGGTAYLFGRQYITVDLPTVSNESNKRRASEDDTETHYEPVDITLIAVGDVTVNSQQLVQSGLKESGSYDYDHLFEHIKAQLNPEDLRIVSQETNLAGSDYGFGNMAMLNAPQELGRAEVSAGFNTVLRASDHSMDWGEQGLHNELSWWHTNEPYIKVLGVAEPDPDTNPGLSDFVNDVYVFEKNDVKVAILNHTSPYNIAEESQGYISVLTEEKIAADVQKAKDAGADFIVACPHWGQEGVAELSEEQTTFAQYYADQGVDLILGAHPRVLQPVEVLKGSGGNKTVCFYSLGCYVSGGAGDNLIGGLADVRLSRDSAGTCSVSSATLKTLITHQGFGTEFTVYPVSEYTDELAMSSSDPTLTPEQIGIRCTELLGEAYDVNAASMSVQL